MKKSELPHYFVKNILFILYDEAMSYCEKNNLSYSEIKKSYYY